MIRRTNIDSRLRVVDGLIKVDAEVLTVNEFTEASAKQLASDVAKLVEIGQGLVPVVIDSYGGDVYALLSMIDTLGACGLPILTFASGKAMSCGAVLLACGTKGMRFVAPNATIMLHEVSWSQMSVKNADMQSDAAECKRLNVMLDHVLDEHCGKKKGYFDRLCKSTSRVDLYLDAKQALKHGLVDHVGVPVLQADVICSVNVAVPK